jgi:predicted O-linked N-acetylglucosamine transferase (SPINDLY family)
MTSSPETTKKILAQALAAHRGGALADAELGYRTILATEPHHGDALHLLGALAVQAGRADQGIALIRRALLARPDNGPAHRNLANALLGDGDAEGALRSYEAACVLEPAGAAAHHGRANALAALGRDDAAIAAQVEAIRCAPDHRDAWYNLGLSLLRTTRHDEAMTSFDRALELGGDPAARANCHVNRAAALRGLGRLEDALVACDAVLGILPGHGAALRNKAMLLDELGRYDACVAACTAALAAEPGHAETMHRRGTALSRLRRHEEAADALREAIAAEPGSARYRNNAGLVLRELGRHKEALACFDAARVIDPGCADIHHGRGLSLHDLGRPREAVESYDAAIAIDPDCAEAHSNRGNALHACGRHMEALDSYARALALRPDYADAMFNRAIALEAIGRHADAIESYGEALSARPDHAAAACNRGNALRELGRDDEAFASYERAIAADPGLAEAHNNLGVLLRARRRVADAERCYRTAIALRPDYAEAWNNLGTALNGLGRAKEALAAYDEAIRLRPGYADAFSNRGGALKDLGRHGAAISSFEQAIAIRPDHADAWYNRGNTLQDQNRFGEAVASSDRAISIAPGHADAHNNRANALLDMRRVGEALAGFADAIATVPGDWDKKSNRLFAMNYAASIAPEEIAAAHRAFGVALAAAHAGTRPPRRATDHRRRLRIGYVSGDFRMHSVGYFIEGILTGHAASGAMDIIAYSNHDGGDIATARMRRNVHAWREIAGVGDEEVAATIRADRIDILVDLSGHTARSRLPLFARRPAPVQASWIGYPQTSGLAEMDWIIADATVLPEEDEHLYVERPMRLAGCYLCYGGPPVVPTPPPALVSGHVTFGCFNVIKKISDPTLGAWAEIIRRVPAARLLVKTHAVRDAGVAAAFRHAFAAHGGDPERLDLEGHLSTEAHWRRFADVDIMLDPFPYNGCTSTAEALNAGVPVIALRGRGGMMTRSGETLLTAAGLEDLIAPDVAGYVDLAVATASDLDRLGRARARVSAAGFSDVAHFAPRLEQAYREMWADGCKRDADLSGVSPTRLAAGSRR